MTAHYCIYVGERPLCWAADEETVHRVGRPIVCAHLYPSKEEAKRVMVEVPALFELDENDAETLHVVEIDLPDLGSSKDSSIS